MKRRASREASRSSRSWSRSRSSGSTLTVILSAQGGLAASNRSAANMGQAVSARPLQDDRDRGEAPQARLPGDRPARTGVPCCEDEKTEVFTCDTRIEKIEHAEHPERQLAR